MSGASGARAPRPEVLAAPPRGSVLLLAPHPDDEVLGAGGTLCLHREQGDPVAVVVAFDGALGLAPGADTELRRREARAGGAHLGVSDYEFLSNPEGHEPTADELERAARRLAEIVRARAPAIVYAPWPGEHHLDHHVLARAVARALELAEFAGEAWGYEVWTPLVAERVVDVGPAWERKLAALGEHASQLAHTDLAHVASGLAAHRSAYLARGARHGEAFARFAAADASGHEGHEGRTP